MIKKITIEVAGRDVDMDLSEAKRLKGVLDDLFKKEYVAIPAPYPVTQTTYPRYPGLGDITYIDSSPNSYLNNKGLSS